MESTSSALCPRCGAPRVPAPECPRCGVYYAKAEAHAARASLAEQEPPTFQAPEPEHPPHLPPETLTWTEEAEEARLELKVRVFAIPAALLLMWMLYSTGVGHMLLRLFLSMWIHELGHAVTAWLCGFAAFPMPWVTHIPPARSTAFALVLAAGLGYLGWRGWKLRQRPQLIAAGVLLGLQFIGTVVLDRAKAQALITFGGDGGSMVLGTLLMMTLYVSKDSSIHKGWLRWGFLVIGAAAFTDIFQMWWKARNDFGVIPFGRLEGVGLSDPSKLTDLYGWSMSALISRYVTLGTLCLVVLGMVYALGVLRARAAVRA
jgi:hypothetical protein